MDYDKFTLNYKIQNKEKIETNKRLNEIKEQIKDIIKEIESMNLEDDFNYTLSYSEKKGFIEDLNKASRKLKKIDVIFEECPKCKESYKRIIVKFEEKAMCLKCVEDILKERSRI